jgi:hypothetical protein
MLVCWVARARSTLLHCQFAAAQSGERPAIPGGDGLQVPQGLGVLVVLHGRLFKDSAPGDPLLQGALRQSTDPLGSARRTSLILSRISFRATATVRAAPPQSGWHPPGALAVILVPSRATVPGRPAPGVHSTSTQGDQHPSQLRKRRPERVMVT